MPKAKKKSIRSLSRQVELFGFSMDAVDVMHKILPKTKSTAILVRNFAKFLHAAESREEFKWPPFAPPILFDLFQERVMIARTRSITFRLPGNLYTPDFNYVLENGLRVHVEVKGSKMQLGYRDAISKQRMAATLYYDEKFVQVMPDKTQPRGWSVEVIEPDPEYGQLLKELFDIVNQDKEII